MSDDTQIASFHSGSEAGTKSKSTSQEGPAKTRASFRAHQLMTAQLFHDLKSFLSVVYCTGQMIQEDSPCPISHKYASQIIKSCESLDRLLEEVLTLSQAEMGNLPVHFADFTVVEDVLEIVQSNRMSAKKKHIGLTLRFDGTVPRKVRTDGLRIHQILGNLVTNAIGFTHTGKVEIVCRYREGFLEFLVTDTGAGIAASQHRRVFEPYRSVRRRASRPGGHGLGLPLARRLARFLGGDVTLVNSKSGVGSTFLARIGVEVVEGSGHDDFVCAGTIECA